MKDDFSFWFGFILGCCIVGGMVALMSAGHYRTKAVKHGAAYYHSETGVFTWRERE